MKNQWFKDYSGLFLIITFSLILKVTLASIGKTINNDGVLYIASAQQYAIGNFSEGLRLWPMPAYPILIALMHFIIPNWIVCTWFISIASLVICSVPLYGITSVLFNRKAAFWATLCLAITPEANENALRAIRDPVFLLITLTAIYFILNGLNQRKLYWIAGGFLLTAISLLFRLEGIVILCTTIIFFGIKSLICHENEMKRFVRKSFAFMIGLPVVAGTILGIFFGHKFLGYNRAHELANELKILIKFSAFEKYNQIYSFFKLVQDKPPFSGFSHSLPATIRHWMPLIYLIGLLESLVKQIFPVFILPLIFTRTIKDSTASSSSHQKQFVILAFVGYMLFLYYFLITRDRMVGRLLFTPAVLLYPWIGNSFHLMMNYFQKQKLSMLFKIIALTVLIALPCVKNVHAIFKSDKSIYEVTNFIKNDQKLAIKKIMFSELRHWLYSNRNENYKEVSRFAILTNTSIKNKLFFEIETIAQTYAADAIVLFFDQKEIEHFPKFGHYRVYKSFTGKKGTTIIYTTLE